MHLISKCSICLAIALAGVAFGKLASGRATAPDLPSFMNYQGRLTGPEGSAITDGSYPAVFKLFPAPTEGTFLWSESDSISTHSGVFSTTLGKVTPLPANLFEQRLWLETEINGTTLVPRQELGSVAYAFTAAIALSVPPNTITGTMIAANTIQSSNIANGAVTHATIGVAAVGSGNLGVGVVTGPAIANGAVGTANLADGGVTGSKIANGAITLGYAASGSNQNLTNTAADLSGLSVTVNVPPGGRPIKITGFVPFENDSASNSVGGFYIAEDGKNLSLTDLAISSQGILLTSTGMVVSHPSPGSHTYKLSGLQITGDGTVKVQAGSGDAAFILVEAI
jgi:hypothetical protein